MEEIIGFVGFSLGASLTIGAVRKVGEGARPLVREVLKGGIRTWDAVTQAGENARESLTHLGADGAEGPAAEGARPRKRRPAEPRKIVIARE